MSSSPTSPLQEKLKELPDKPGVYLMRDERQKVIYVGKALSLRNRVRQYFQQSTIEHAPPKLQHLVQSIHTFDTIEVATEAEALLYEARLIKEYRPRYNVSLKDDKRYLLLRINLKTPYPRFETCRIKKKDQCTYFGPYASSAGARAAMEFVEKEFHLRVCKPVHPGEQDYTHCLNDIIRYCSAPCIGRISREEYRHNVLEACAFLRGEKPGYMKQLRQRMQEASRERQYEKAAAYRDILRFLHEAARRHHRMAATPALKKERALAGLEELKDRLGLDRLPAVIECYDISNISGTYSVASRVCARNGLAYKKKYRMYRIKTVQGADDPQSIGEVIERRFQRGLAEREAMPDLVIVDGGITQLRAAQDRLTALGLHHVPVAGLAKKFEEIYMERNGTVEVVRFDAGCDALKVLQQIRDEAHRFALTYHRKLRDQRIRESSLDDIEGIGDKMKQHLLITFGSIKRLERAGLEELQAVKGLGPVLAARIYAFYHSEQ